MEDISIGATGLRKRDICGRDEEDNVFEGAKMRNGYVS
jgi:hypothetical protein